METDSKQAPSNEGPGVRPDPSEHQNPPASVTGAEARHSDPGLANQCILQFLLAPAVGSGTSTVLKSGQRILTSRLLWLLSTEVTKRIGSKDAAVPGHFAK